MLDKPQPETSDATEVTALPRGITLLVESALHAPPPPPDAESAAQERALSAYQQALLAPRPLHAEAWHAEGGGALAGRVSRFFRRLRGR